MDFLVRTGSVVEGEEALSSDIKGIHEESSPALQIGRAIWHHENFGNQAIPRTRLDFLSSGARQQ